MHFDVIFECRRMSESTSQHTLECQNLIGQNELVSYIPNFEDLYENGFKEHVYIARILGDNLRRLPCM